MSPGALSPQSLNTMELSHEFSIDDYQYVEASINLGNDMDVATSVARDEQNDVPKVVRRLFQRALCISGESLVKTVEIDLPL